MVHNSLVPPWAQIRLCHVQVGNSLHSSARAESEARHGALKTTTRREEAVLGTSYALLLVLAEECSFDGPLSPCCTLSSMQN